MQDEYFNDQITLTDQTQINWKHIKKSKIGDQIHSILIDNINPQQELCIQISESEFQDRLQLIKELNEAQKQLSDIKQNKDDPMIFKAINVTSNEVSILRCKKVTPNTNLKDMAQKFGMLSLGQKKEANKDFKIKHKNEIFKPSEISDQFHNLDGKLAKEHRVEVIKEYSKIFKKQKIESIKHLTIDEQIERMRFNSKYRQAIQKIQVINRRKSGKNILPVLSSERTISVESVFSDLNNSRSKSPLEQEILYSNKPEPRIGLQRRVGGGFTQRRRNLEFEHYFT